MLKFNYGNNFISSEGNYMFLSFDNKNSMAYVSGVSSHQKNLARL